MVERCVALDVHKDSLAAGVSVRVAAGRCHQKTRSFTRPTSCCGGAS